MYGMEYNFHYPPMSLKTIQMYFIKFLCISFCIFQPPDLWFSINFLPIKNGFLLISFSVTFFESGNLMIMKITLHVYY